jgi:predicted nucleic acid-binding protein
MSPYVLDTSAVLALLEDEAGADEVESILDPERDENAPEVYLPFMTLMEVEYSVLRRYDSEWRDEALRLVQTWPAMTVESNLQWRREAARVKAGASLSVADAWNAALALLLDAELVHKDPEFDQVEGLRSLRLPYKPKTR